MSDDKNVDPGAEATTSATTGTSTGPNSKSGYADTDIFDGAEPDPDLAQGEKK